MENNMMWLFKSHASPLLPRPPKYEVEWLAIAQHHGLATRLLDWTLSPLVAMFFAVNPLTKGEGAVYIYEVDRFRKEEEINLKGLYTVEAFFPSHSSNRITAQQGMFTVHPFEEKKLEKGKITKVIFTEDLKHHFQVRMDKYGINYYSTFPDLDGLSKYVRHATGFGL